VAFRSEYIWIALGTALGAGFPVGAYLAGCLNLSKQT
jgi:hypothetical protein